MQPRPAPTRDASKLQRHLASQIAQHIATSGLRPGEAVREVLFADLFKVSRTPVHAALKLLAETGIVERSERRGFRVGNPEIRFVDPDAEDSSNEEEDLLYLRIATDYLAGDVAEQFSEADMMRRYSVNKGMLGRVLQRMAHDAMVERNQGHGWHFTPMFTSTEAESDSYRFRMAIEPAALLEPSYSLDITRAAACRRDHETILASPTRVSPLRFFEVNAEFHEMVTAGSGNSFMLQAIQHQNRLRRLFVLHWPYPYERVIASCHEHLEILSAIEAGDHTWASTLLRRHLDLAAGVKE